MNLTWAQLDAIERELWSEKQRLQKLRSDNNALDAALVAPDPVAALRELATVDLVTVELGRGLARVAALKGDIKRQQATHERNLKAHARL